MKRALLVIALSCVFPFIVCSQTGWQWAVGNKSSVGSFTEGWPVAADIFGNVFGAGIIQHGDSSVFGPFEIYNPRHINQAFITKVNSVGSYEWVLGASNDYVRIGKMCTDADGNLYAIATYHLDSMTIGSYVLTQPGFNEMYALIKISQTGNVIWAKNIAPHYLYQSGPFAALPFIGDIGLDNVGNIYVAGEFRSDSIVIGGTVLYNSDSSIGVGGNLFIAKYDSSGSPIWAKCTNDRLGVTLAAMAVSQNGSLFIVGGFNDTLSFGAISLMSPVDTGAPFIAKFDSSGNIIWAVKHNLRNLGYVNATTDNNGRLYLLGLLDHSIIYGPISLHVNDGTINILIACIDSSSEIVWAKTAQGMVFSNGASISVDLCGKLCISGSLNKTPGYIIFGSDTLNVPPGSNDPVFIAVYDTSGNYLVSSAIASGGDDLSASCVDKKGNLYVCGDVYSVPLIAGADTLVPFNLEDFFIAKYRYDDAICPAEASGIRVIEKKCRVEIFPNPASDEIMIRTEEGIFSSLTIFNCMGQLLVKSSVSSNGITLSTASLPAGVYYLSLYGEREHIVKRFVKL